MIRIFPNPEAYLSHLESLEEKTDSVARLVTDILTGVREGGDEALRRYCEQFDGVVPETFLVPQPKLDEAVAYLDPAVKDVWIQAIENIEQYHRRQREDSRLQFFEDGSVLGWKVTSIDRVGVYIPGGTAVYPSSLFMNVIPAQVAGVPRMVLCSPPGA
ncbi:MAG: histidinol dehydrogenase, partial [SAR324 cluster bacterium]|nr:histidinol dehydrogenase [SAR324 cluster bacterium]